MNESWYNSGSEGKPRCNRCSSTDVRLIDIVFDQAFTTGGYCGQDIRIRSIPVWYCDSCNQTIAGRTYGMESLITSNAKCPDINIHLENPSRVFDLDSAMSDVQRKLKDLAAKAEETRKAVDTLGSLKERIGSFTLE